MVLVLESCSLEEACAALGQTTKVLFELRDRLRDWLKLQPHLPQDITDNLLLHYIIGTKMRLELAKQKLDMRFTLEVKLPEFYTGRDPRRPNFVQLHKMAQVVYLPKLTPEKYSVIIVRPIADDYKKFSAAENLKYVYMLGDIILNEIHNLGTIFVMDHSKASLGYVSSFSPMLIKKCEVATANNAVRLKGIHLLNASRVTNQLITVGKSVLKPKLAARIHVHQPGSYESFHKLIPKSILPKDYGGDEISMDELSEKWRQKVDGYRDVYLKQEKFFVDERLRPGPALNDDEIFGISGSFRKLDVD